MHGMKSIFSKIVNLRKSIQIFQICSLQKVDQSPCFWALLSLWNVDCKIILQKVSNPKIRMLKKSKTSFVIMILHSPPHAAPSPGKKDRSWERIPSPSTPFANAPPPGDPIVNEPNFYIILTRILFSGI